MTLYKWLLGLFVMFLVIMLVPVDALSEYCSPVNRKELFEKLESCFTIKSAGLTAPTSTPIVGATRNFGLSTVSSSNSSQTQPNQVRIEFTF